jgi:hypothetical protein
MLTLSLMASGLPAGDVKQKHVVLAGTATDCDRGEVIKIHSMDVRALSPSKHRDIIVLLRSMDTVTWEGDGVESMRRFEPLYERMVDLLVKSKPLAHDTTTQSGKFSLTVPLADSVVVIGQADLEDEPTYHAYKMVSARNSATFELDMSDAECSKDREKKLSK